MDNTSEFLTSFLALNEKIIENPFSIRKVIMTEYPYWQREE